MSSYFIEWVHRIGERSLFQEKRLAKALAGRDAAFFETAEHLASRYTDFFLRTGVSLEAGVDAYLKLCDTLFCDQLEFRRTGRYPNEGALAAPDIYQNASDMGSYMLGLALSLFLWPTHYDMFRFFSESLRRWGPGIHSLMEIGPGHGLLLDTALSQVPGDIPVTVVDIAPASIQMTRDLMAYLHPERKDINFVLADITAFTPSARQSFITMGEVIEHLPDPRAALLRLKEWIAHDGVIYISTCANAPAVDHLVRFRNAAEIRSLFQDCGWRIIDDRVLPTENLPADELDRQLIPVNYCAILALENV